MSVARILLKTYGQHFQESFSAKSIKKTENLNYSKTESQIDKVWYLKILYELSHNFHSSKKKNLANIPFISVIIQKSEDYSWS